MRAKPPKKHFIDLASVEVREVDWLLPPLIPYGMITIMEGDPGVGKSYLAMHIAAQISVGGKLPGLKKVPKGGVLYLSAEDDASYTIRPRIEAMGGDVALIRIQADYLTLDEKGLQALMEEVKQNPPELIIIDPLFAYIAADQDIYRPNVIRGLLSQLKDIAEREGTAILIVRHLTKGRRDKAIYQGSGSMDVIGAARSAFLVAEHPGDSSQKIVAHIKHNLSERGQSWLYHLVEKDGDIPVLEWLGPSELTADDIYGANSLDQKSQLAEAIKFIEQALKDGPVSAKLLAERAEAEGHSKRTYDRARRDAGVLSKKTRNEWVLSLPAKEKGSS